MTGKKNPYHARQNAKKAQNPNDKPPHPNASTPSGNSKDRTHWKSRKSHQWWNNCYHSSSPSGNYDNHTHWKSHEDRQGWNNSSYGRQGPGREPDSKFSSELDSHFRYQGAWIVDEKDGREKYETQQVEEWEENKCTRCLGPVNTKRICEWCKADFGHFFAWLESPRLMKFEKLVESQYDGENGELITSAQDPEAFVDVLFDCTEDMEPYCNGHPSFMGSGEDETARSIELKQEGARPVVELPKMNDVQDGLALVKATTRYAKNGGIGAPHKGSIGY